MIKQYSILLIFLFFALLGLISLQGYFTYNDYQIKKIEFGQMIDQSFSKAVRIEQKERKLLVLSAFRSVLSDPSKIEISAAFDNLENKTIYHLGDPITGEKYTSISFKEDNRVLDSLSEADRLQTINLLVEATSKYLDEKAIYYWTDVLGEKMIALTDSIIVDTNRLAFIYDSLLRLENISSPFKIILVDQKKESQRDTLNSLQTKTYDTDLYSDQWDAYAYFIKPFRDILKKAWLTIGGSLFIVLITGLAFFVLLKTIFEQKKLAEIKADFIDNISHELQTPLATLKAANEGMEKFGVLNDSIKAERYVQMQKHAIHRLATMIDELLRNSIYKRNFQQKSRAEVNLKQLTHAIITRYKLKSEKPITFEYRSDSSQTTLLGDPTVIETICDNLIGNAIKHNQGKQVDIKVKTYFDQNHFMLLISDNGPGIPDLLRAKVFERFYQVNPTIEGQGLGLAYVKELVEDLNGKIWISRSDSNGTQFNIQLPKYGDEK